MFTLVRTLLGAFWRYWRNFEDNDGISRLLRRTIHYNDVITGAIASQITSLTIVYSTVYTGADQRKHQSSASRAFVGNSPVTGEFPAQMASNAENVSIWWRHNVRRDIVVIILHGHWLWHQVINIWIWIYGKSFAFDSGLGKWDGNVIIQYTPIPHFVLLITHAFNTVMPWGVDCLHKN